MRRWLLMLALVVGCQEHSATTTKVVLAAPKVKLASVLADDSGAPPALLLVDETDVARIAAAATWADLDAHRVTLAERPGSLGELARALRSDEGVDGSPLATVKRWNERTGLDLGAPDTVETATLDAPEPSAEEEEEEEEDGEWDGPGVLYEPALGKLGKKDSDRAEGQYKMLKQSDDPKLAREHAIRQAHDAGLLGGKAAGPVPMLALGRADGPLRADGTPSRVAEVEGNVMREGRFERLRTLIVIPPDARATRLIQVIRETGGAIAVMHDGKIRPLNLEFRVEGSRDQSASDEWLEARVSTTRITVEAVPDTATGVETLDELAPALRAARDARALDAETPVDVLVDADVDVQRLSDVLVALETAGVHTIGLGTGPSVEQLARRGHRIPKLSLGQPNVQGDLARSVIRRFVKANASTFRACYGKALLANPSLAGTVQTQFFIMPSGAVATVAAAGVNPGLANCIADALKAIVFPEPAGGGGVQVNYPLTFRP